MDTPYNNGCNRVSDTGGDVLSWKFWKKEPNEKRTDLVQPFREVKHKWHSNHTAYRDVLDWDDAKKRFILNRSTIAQCDVVPSDLMVDGDKWRVFQTPLELPTIPDERTEIEEDGEEHTYLNPTPISYNLYYESDILNQAITGEFRSKVINPLVLAVIIGVGIVLLLVMVI